MRPFCGFPLAPKKQKTKAKHIPIYKVRSMGGTIYVFLPLYQSVYLSVYMLHVDATQPATCAPCPSHFLVVPFMSLHLHSFPSFAFLSLNSRGSFLEFPSLPFISLQFPAFPFIFISFHFISFHFTSFSCFQNSLHQSPRYFANPSPRSRDGAAHVPSSTGG